MIGWIQECISHFRVPLPVLRNLPPSVGCVRMQNFSPSQPSLCFTTMNLKPHTASPVLRAWLISSTLLLIPFGHSSELPIAIMAIWGIRLWIQQGRVFIWNGNARLFSIVFLLFIVPMALALLNAVFLPRSLNTVLTYPRLYLAGLFVIYALKDEKVRQLVFKICAYLIAFWVLDGLIQALFGYDLLGNPYPTRVNGPFPGGLRYGVYLPILSPILLEYARKNWHPWMQLTIFSALTGAVLLGGFRSGWLMYGVVIFAYWLMFLRKKPSAAFKIFIAASLVAILAGVLLFNVSQRFSDRVNQSFDVFKLNYSGINDASSNRLPIWETGLKIVEANPILGIGPRGFRYAYGQYGSPGDYWMTHSPKYPHQLYLEVALESGIVGLVSLLSALLLLARNGLQSLKDNPAPGLIAFGLSLLAIYFPFNTHPAIYSADFSLLVWWLTSLYCGYGTRKTHYKSTVYDV